MLMMERVLLCWLPALGHREVADGPECCAWGHIISRSYMSVSGLKAFMQVVYMGLVSLMYVFLGW